MKIKKLFIALVVLGFAAVATIYSCKKGDLNTTDPNVLSLANSFKSSADILAATNSIYSVMHSNDIIGRWQFWVHDLRADDGKSGGGQLGADLLSILNGVNTPSNDITTPYFTALYTQIHRANTVLDNAPRATDNAALVARCVGEAKFLRAWAYFELVSMWGKVPVYTTTVKTPSASAPLSSVSDVYALIIKDLTDAAVALPGKSAYGPSDLGRATNAAAWGMLGRAYMQEGDYKDAEAALLKIPSSGADGYSLVTNFSDNFKQETAFNNESVFEVIFTDKGDNNFNWGGDNGVGDGPTADQTTVRNQEYNPIAWRNLIPSEHWAAEFENTVTGAAKTDPRFGFSIYKTGDAFDNDPGPGTVLVDADQNGQTTHYLGADIKLGYRKYMLIYEENRSTASFHPGGVDARLLRYADVLLMLAECANENGDMAGAIGYLNQVRARPSVAMPPYPTSQFPVANKDGVTLAIMHERQVELGNEELRNIDIIRWRNKGYYPSIAPEPISYYKKAGDEFLAIPEAETDNNANLQ